NLIEGEEQDKYQAKLRIKGGSIIPAGAIIQNAGENSFDPLSLYVCPDQNGNAIGELYVDSGDGFGFQKGDYALVTFTAEKKKGSVLVKATGKLGKRNIDQEITKIKVQ
ncbi:DUF5110 domain-containing protein, partial [Flavobacterium circumlabens]